MNPGDDGQYGFVHQLLRENIFEKEKPVKQRGAQANEAETEELEQQVSMS